MTILFLISPFPATLLKKIVPLFCSQNHGLKKLPRSLDNGYWLTNKTNICFGPLHARYVIYLNFTIRMSFSTRASQVPGWRKSDQKQEI